MTFLKITGFLNSWSKPLGGNTYVVHVAAVARQMPVTKARRLQMQGAHPYLPAVFGTVGQRSSPEFVLGAATCSPQMRICWESRRH
jgi:hypothetical protein